MIPSQELKDVILHWYLAISSRDTSGVVESLLSRQDGFVAIGTDPTVWIQGSEPIIQVYQAIVKAGMLVKIDFDEGAWRWLCRMNQ